MDGVIDAGGGARMTVLGDGITVKARADDDRYALFEVDSREAGPPLHTHAWDETYFILTGAVDVQVGARRLRATAGMTVHIPGGTPHSYSTRESGPCRFLVAVAPANAIEFFAELDRECGQGAPDMAKVIAIATKHGVAPVMQAA